MQLREHLKLTQSEFGEKINVSKFSISNYETGKRPLTERNIADICQNLNVSEKWLRTGEGEIFTNATAHNFKELMTIINDLSPELQDYMLQQAKALRDLQNSRKV